MRKSIHSRGAKALLGAVSAVLVVALTAVAYFASTSGGSGTGQKQLGYGGEGVQLTYNVTFNEGLKPGEESPVGITTKNTSSKPTDIATWSLTPSIDEEHVAAGCQLSWFEVYFKVGGEKPEWSYMLEKTQTLPIAAGEEVVVSGGEKVENWGKWGAQYFIRFKEEPVNQSACEGATLTLTAKSTA